VAAFAVLSARGDTEAAWLVAIDSMALVPLLLAGADEALPSSGRGAARWLERVFRKLTSARARAEDLRLRVLPWARVRMHSSEVDELRLLVLPRLAMPGVLAVEVGMAWASTPAGWAPAPEVLARVIEESPAAARLSAELPRLRAVPGRRPEERVVRMLPCAPTCASTVALVRAVSSTLTDRRVTIASSWKAPERRVRLQTPDPPHPGGERAVVEAAA
jgi:hypothetical protein